MLAVETDTRPWGSAGAGSKSVFPFKSAGLRGGAESDLGLPRTGDQTLREPLLGVRARAMRGRNLGEPAWLAQAPDEEVQGGGGAEGGS